MLQSQILRIGWLLSVGLVVALSLLPNASPPSSIPDSDKIAHFIAYSWLSGLAYMAWPRNRAWTRAWIALGLGIALEFCQMLVPQRSFSVFDMLANASGVAFGWWLCSRLLHKVKIGRAA
ncbi:VanZ family protein [Oceanidesulfovibrio marinus]|uniref:VanZ family protein n=1 Tax=Oceanidesulfovibrio marinus TaxID=370038 RepID=A0A6P1ZK80_9BACT|nr:VanZ family protein [Oceanidesulfovibrio marinus]QJT08310.1 VanZ family protein [Oceanidesulfovibrio marinus]TVM35200.1 hypothetical protein DQK91_07350 [Oceanidesulfovibrio marinus]